MGKASLTSVNTEGAECERWVRFLFLFKFEMRLAKEELGVVMIGITASVVIIRAVDCRQGEPRSRRLEVNSLLGDGLLDSSPAAVLERRASSMVNPHDMK